MQKTFLTKKKIAIFLFISGYLRKIFNTFQTPLFLQKLQKPSFSITVKPGYLDNPSYPGSWITRVLINSGGYLGMYYIKNYTIMIPTGNHPGVFFLTHGSYPVSLLVYHCSNYAQNRNVFILAVLILFHHHLINTLILTS